MHGLLLFIGIEECLKDHEEVHPDCDIDPTSTDTPTADSDPDSADNDHEHDLDSNADDMIDPNNVSICIHM